MSRKQFIKETAEHTNWRIKNNLPVHISIYNVDKFIRDKWISENRHDELIKYILNEWDNGDFNIDNNFIEGYEQQLLQRNLSEPFIKLWKGILKIRINNWWWHYRRSISGKEMYKNSSIEKHESLLSGIQRYIDGLLELKQFEEIKNILRVKETVENLRRPKIN